MHPYISQSLIDVMVADRLHQAAAARQARQARATARSQATSTARKRASRQSEPIEATVPAQSYAVWTARHAHLTSSELARAGTAARGHGATAVEVDQERQMCDAAR